MSNTKDLLNRDKAVIWHPFTPLMAGQDTIAVSSTKGVYLHTPDGRKIIDAVSSWWVNLHGHSHPHIAKAVAEQAASLEHVIFAGFTHEPAVQLAEALVRILPSNQKKIFYSDNGSTAVEVALKMAFQYWHNKGVQKTKVIALDGAYHGDTFGAMSVGERGAFSAPFNPYLFEVDFLPFPDAQQEEKVLALLEHKLKTGQVASFIYEPLVQGSAGMRMYSSTVLNAMIEMAKKYGAICIADEVMTGFGRTGKTFASEYAIAQPDICCLSKGLTGGTMALGVTSCTDEIMDAYRSQDILKTFFHGHSFTANPIACAAAIASLELLERPETAKNIQRISQQQEAFVNSIKSHPAVRAARNLGTIAALEIAAFEDTSYFNEARHKLYPFFLERDILLRPLGNVIYILPPYVITDEQLSKVYCAIIDLLDQF